ncbi:MAG: MaoC family dehydratase [Burkholderiales bacterium]|nr:MaoC family dehydratase [Burkholderiales bacterium]
MSESGDAQWIEPYEGYKFAAREMTVEAGEQERLLALCGIDPALFAGAMDPAGFISLAIQEGVRNRVHANGTVNMINSIRQDRPTALGEPLVVSGEIVSVEEVPRGRVATSETLFSGKDGRRAFSSRRSSLRPDAAKAGVRGAGERPGAVIDDCSRLRPMGRFTLTPEGVQAYSGPHNPIHFDPEAAKRGGFRAPIIGGGQGVRFLTATIWRHFRPQVLELDVFFRRPIFWDDSFEVMVDERDGKWRAICLAKDGKVATEARINVLE